MILSVEHSENIFKENSIIPFKNNVFIFRI